jgi:molybdate transport system substrate-binding protein|tara:strand:+ start:23 stop:799 length:777 start_codon:yes stop_codon:yes gene_type:complete
LNLNKPRKINLLLLAVIFSLPSVRAESINVAVASNFSAALEEVKTIFESNTDHKIVVIRGSTGKHFTQILNGAPFDLFLAADQARPARLQEQYNIVLRRSYAIGRLALWGRGEGPLKEDSLADMILKTPNQRLAIANPLLAPYGSAALETLNYLGLKNKSEGRIVTGENIAQAFQFAYSGGAKFGLVAYSQVINVGELGNFWLVPPTHHSQIIQDMVLLSESAAARELFEFLTSTKMSQILWDHGYLEPGSGRAQTRN